MSRVLRARRASTSSPSSSAAWSRTWCQALDAQPVGGGGGGADQAAAGTRPRRTWTTATTCRPTRSTTSSRSSRRCSIPCCRGPPCRHPPGRRTPSCARLAGSAPSAADAAGRAACAHMPIRHWDGYWFGRERLWGDVFPHYWSVLSAAAYLTAGRTAAARRAATAGLPDAGRAILRANLIGSAPTVRHAARSSTPAASTAGPPTGPTRWPTTRTGRWSTPCAMAWDRTTTRWPMGLTTPRWGYIDPRASCIAEQRVRSYLVP